MKDEKHESAPQSNVDGALFEYLNDMLQDPAAGKLSSINKPRFKLAPMPSSAAKRSPEANTKPDSSEAKAASNVHLIKPDSVRPQQSATTSVDKKERRLTATAEQPAADGKRAAWLSPGLLVPRDNVAESSEESAPADQPEQSNGAKINARVPLEADPEQSKEDSTPEWIETVPEAKPWCENGRPQWAQQEFECLIFTVNGLKLAVPLVTLGSIQPLDKKLTSLPGQPDWFMGILPATSMGNLKVLDTALCVMPERYRADSRDTLRYVISIHDCAWGLACDSVDKSITLRPDQVKWRSQRGKRPWLAGTVVEYMCSLVDTDGFHEFLI